MPAAGYKNFVTGDVLTAAQVNDYLMLQTVMVFANSAARTSALSGVLAEGLVSYLKDTDVVEIYTGAAWVSLDDPNAIQNSIVDAKGDIITATADNTPSRLAVGANATVLTADSTTATGLKWATVSTAPTFVGCSIYATAQNISTATLTNIAYANEFFDSDGFHDNTTNNSRITIPAGKAGKYLLTTTVQFDNNASTAQQILQNGTAIGGTAYGYMTFLNASTGRNHIQSTAIVNAAVSDYFQSVAYQASGATKSLEASRFDCTYLGA